jgi:hypothetical protein
LFGAFWDKDPNPVGDSTHHRSSINGKIFCDKLYKKL